MDITALIPAHNEGERLEAVVKPLFYVPDIHQIIVIDDGSSDATNINIVRLGVEGISIPGNEGKTAALARGLEEARSPWVLLLDADLVGLRPYHIQAMISRVMQDNADEVIGVLPSHTVALSGQRLLPKICAEAGVTAAHGYGIEVALNQLAKEYHWRVETVDLTGVYNISKIVKWGIPYGMAKNMEMVSDIFDQGSMK